MRAFLLIALSLWLTSCGTTPKPTPSVSAVTIKTIKPSYLQATHFIRVREYMTGAEHTGKQVVLRSDPETREGFYFILVLDTKLHRLPPGCALIGEFYTPASPDLQTHHFALPSQRPKTREILVGLTGSDWPFGADRMPSAWRFTVVDANGQPLGHKQSYLWSL
jgi:hypothetical protein